MALGQVETVGQIFRGLLRSKQPREELSLALLRVGLGGAHLPVEDVALAEGGPARLPVTLPRAAAAQRVARKERVLGLRLVAEREDGPEVALAHVETDVDQLGALIGGAAAPPHHQLFHVSGVAGAAQLAHLYYLAPRLRVEKNSGCGALEGHFRRGGLVGRALSVTGGGLAGAGEHHAGALGHGDH